MYKGDLCLPYFYVYYIKTLDNPLFMCYNIIEVKITYIYRKEMIIMFNVICADGYVVCECDSLKEAVQCKAELITIDKADGVYEKGFYKIVRA